MKKIKTFFVLLISMLVLSLVSCNVNDAGVARYNLEREEKNFNVYRRAVFYNGITGDYILLIEGYLAIAVEGSKKLTVTVKTGDGKY